MYKKNIVLMFYIVLAFVVQYKLLLADVKLLGYIHNDLGFVSNAPLGHSNIWKAFRYQATVNGHMDYFQMFLGGFVDTLETDNEVAWAIYEDNNLHVGTLKVSGYVPNYNWTIIGPGENHTFPLTTVHQNRDIIAGSYYWVTFHATGGNNILISRGRVSGCNPGSLRWGTNQHSWLIFNPPPPPNEFVISFNQGCYGWAVWQADSNDISNYSKKLPSNYRLYQNFPNPFNPTTQIGFDLPEISNVVIDIYNILGQKMMTFIKEEKEAGYHQIVIDAFNLPNGIYFYKLSTNHFQEMKKMIILK